ncbi:hypothetical protein [Aequorivita antarctica]|uniref:Uncharacterized protein n=1 Tax=Aequorivita antarctica TaxID=153266 RepID=A0A5C6YXY8_9FLAO|nr:hypothetical protein [Aequorivita antarctica]TXD72316.1 hypothetical protein ESU54_12900 [Aequorivita antarctica]SRX74453.1 hypothetical protein AEQU3_01432 [Aequorivita antarctica]
MKKIYILRFFLLLFIGIVFFSCQKEEKEYIDETPADTITAGSPLTGLLLRTSQNPGSYDDIIDGNGCASVVLPITVVANGQQLTINIPDDVLLIQQIFNQFPNDTDTLEIAFPITLELFDFTQLEVNTQAELDALAATCGVNDVEIGCLDFVYPISFFTYNSDQQQTGSVFVNNDLELFSFLQGLGPNDFISLDFPISVILVDGSTSEVNSNQQLQTLIADCVANTNNNPIDISQFEEDLTTGNWYVEYYFNDYDETDNYAGYEFNFALDGTAQAVKSGTTISGTWALVNDFKFDLFFGTNAPLNEFDEDWEILEATSEIIKLKHISGSDGSVDYLTFGRNPNTGGNNTELNLFIENLSTGSWFVNLLEENGTDHTANFNEYEFAFLRNGSAIAVSNNNTINGFWTAAIDSGNLDFILNFETGTNGNFGELNDDWDVLEATQTIIRLSDVSGGGGRTDRLTFGREPNGGGGGGPDPQELRDILQSGTWYIEKYLDDGDDETSDYSGYDFTFFANQNILATNGSQNVDGIWIVTLTGQELNFEFNMDSPINGADNDEYKALQYSPTSVTFITRNSQGEIEDTLIFKKN